MTLEQIGKHALKFPQDEGKQWEAMHAYRVAANAEKNLPKKQRYRKLQHFFGKRAVKLGDIAIARFVKQGGRW
jgi:hypothetical protein